jgi:phytoene dehydrogenase-like protein
LVVVGAGLAGLAAGATARRAGLDAVVLDGRSAGGRARSSTRDGFVFNQGAHALLSAGAGARVLAALGVRPVGAPPPLDRYRLALGSGELQRLPSSPMSLARTGAVGARDKVRLARLLATLPRLDASSLAGTSVSDWIASHGFEGRAASVVTALLRLGTYASDLTTFGADAAAEQMRLATRGVLYLHDGWQQLVAALSALADVRTGFRVTGIEPVAGGFEVRAGESTWRTRSVVVATGTPASVRSVLPLDPGWGDLGPEITAACLDVGVRGLPDPGYVLGVDRPVYTTIQGPPARQAPPGAAAVASIRYGATGAESDELELEANLVLAGVEDSAVVTRRFIPRMVVAGAAPLAARGGTAGRPPVEVSGVPGLFVAGDWVGPVGLLADASLSSGAETARLAGIVAERWRHQSGVVTG